MQTKPKRSRPGRSGARGPSTTPETATPIPCVRSSRSQTDRTRGENGREKVPIGIPADSAPYDPLVWQETPENEEDEEEVGRRPGNEPVELWCSRPVFLRLWRECGQRSGWRSRLLHCSPSHLLKEKESGEEREKLGAGRSVPFGCRNNKCRD